MEHFQNLQKQDRIRKFYFGKISQEYGVDIVLVLTLVIYRLHLWSQLLGCNINPIEVEVSISGFALLKELVQISD